MEMFLDEKQFDKLMNKILREHGFDCHQYRLSFIKRRLLSRLRATKQNSYQDYANYLDTHPEEHHLLLDALTINVSEFFRDPTVFHAFRQLVLPEIIKRKKNRKQKLIRIWSVGCATGEEPYSIALILHLALSYSIKDFKVSIYGTDIDKKALEIAKVGKYSPSSVRHVPQNYLRRYFRWDGQLYLIKNMVKSLVKFKYFNVFTDNSIKFVDVIFCRNVLIYFSRKEQKKIYKLFHQALNEGGYLVIGKTETLPEEVQKFFLTLSVKERIYQKIPLRILKEE